jgi:hypothetical protein
VAGVGLLDKVFIERRGVGRWDGQWIHTLLLVQLKVEGQKARSEN